MLNKIISSEARLSILDTLFFEPEKEWKFREIVNNSKIDAANVHKELSNLSDAEVILVLKKDEDKTYILNKSNSYFNEFNSLFKKYRDEANADKWFVAEEIPRVHPSATITYTQYRESKKYLKEKFGIIYDCQTIQINERRVARMCHIKSEYSRFAKEVFKRLTDDYRWGIKINETVKEESDKWFKTAKKIYNANLRNSSDEELLEQYQEFYTKQKNSHITGWPSNAVDLDENHFSRHLLGIISKKIKDLGLPLKVGEVFSILTTPLEESYAQKEYRALIEILEKILERKEVVDLFKNNDTHIIEERLKKLFPSFYEIVDGHRRAFGWLSYQFEGPGWQNDYFIDILASLVRQNASPQKILSEYDKKNISLNKQQADLVKELDLGKEEIGLFEVAKGFVFMKGYRKDQMFYGLYCQEFLFREIGRRAFLSLKQVRQIYPWEMKDCILRKKVDPNELNRRIEYHIFYSFTDKQGVISGEAARQFIGKLSFVKEETREIDSLDGDTASPGKVRGRVVVVNVPEDMKNMKDGSILVSIATSPDLVPAIKKAGAIVTDMGGVTCHAAIISRELGIPCIIGTKMATKVLKDGYLIDVDATHGRVNIISKNDK